MTDPARPDDRLVWLDLEMTGLDVEHDVIVEIGCLVTDAELEPLDDGVDIVVQCAAEALARMEDVVRSMHTRSGLLRAIEASEVAAARRGSPRARVRARARAAGGRRPLCGNTIGIDRRFLARQLPELDRHLHYRSIDVTALKELCRRWYPEVYRRRPGKQETSPGPRRRPRLDGRARLLPRTRSSSPARS